MHNEKESIHEEYRWGTLIFISNNFIPYNFLEIPSEFCPNSDWVKDMDLNMKARGTMPLIWHDTTWTYKGKCHE